MRASAGTTPRVMISGGPRTGKTTTLVESIITAAKSGRVLVLAPSKPIVARLKGALERDPEFSNITLATTGTFAVSVLQTFAENDPRLASARIVDDVEAEVEFAAAAQPLLALEWPEFAEETLDPEIPGLRSPERFLESAFRLIRKLRDAQISPAGFLESAQRGATAFYGKPPNLASPDVLFYTKDSYRDSLDVTPEELQRQFKHETHLAKILARLYETYLERQQERGTYTQRDAIAEATRLLGAGGSWPAHLHGFTAAFIDEAHAMTLGELFFLQALFSEALGSVTFAGDPNGSIDTFRARPDRVFALPADSTTRTVQMSVSYVPTLTPELFRATDAETEARFVAESIAERIQAGENPTNIAVLFRSVRSVHVYENALIARDIPVEVIGDVNLFEDPRALDALALLWTIQDPHRHEWLLRTLASPAFALSDASLAVLCTIPPDAQTELFTLDEEQAPTVRPAGKDPQRATRLGENVITGSQDAQLTPLARERVQHFRKLREEWLSQRNLLQLPDLIRLVWSEGLARLGPPESARAKGQQLILTRLLTRVENFINRHTGALDMLGDFLRDAEIRAQSDLEVCEDEATTASVRIMSIDAARGQHFPHVYLPNIRPGAFPRWYVPDAFLYSPSLGMIAKENVGDAVASRTAKVSYYLYRTKARERYNEEERRAFEYAKTRATESLTVSSWDRPTRGITAPEFFEELKARQR